MTTTTRVVHFERHVEHVGYQGIENVGAVFTNHDDASGLPLTILRVDSQAWRDMGEPTVLTVTIAPGELDGGAL